MNELQKLLFDLLKNNIEDGYTRNELVILTGIPRSTIYDALDGLKTDYNLLKKVPVPRTESGRPKIKWVINKMVD
jgi:hypothetical protein